MRKYWHFGLVIAFIVSCVWIYFSDKSQQEILENGLVKSFLFDSITSFSQPVNNLENKAPTTSKEFNGVTDIIIEDVNEIELRENFTVSFWVYAEKKDHYQVLLLKGENCPDGNPHYQGIDFEAAITSENLISFKVFAENNDYAPEYIHLSAEDPIPLNSWLFITITFDFKDQTFKYFLNAKPAAYQQVSTIHTEDFHLSQSNTSFKLGGDENYCGYQHKYTHFFQGYLGDVYLFDRQLSENEILKLGGFSTGTKKRYSIAFFLFVLVALGIHYFDRNYFLPTKSGNSEKFIKVSFTLITIATYYLLFSSQMKFTDTAYFGGDTWEYQSMAANIAMGHGLQRFGGIEDFEKYKFDRLDTTIFSQFRDEAGSFNDYRTPLYPTLLGALYTVAGISPALAKKIQLLLLVIIGSLIPWIGYYYWGGKGIISGTIAGLIFLLKYHQMAHNILSETLFSFLILLVIIFAILFERNRNLFTAAALGISLGLALLTKGNLLFVPIIFFLYLLKNYFLSRDTQMLRNGLILVTAFILTIAPWSIYASSQTHKVIILSTQAENVLLDCNNENSIDGNWHPEWRKSSDGSYFYNQDNMDGKSPIIRVLNFYFHNPGLLLPSIINKIYRGFKPFPFLFFSILFVFYEVLNKYIKKFSNNRWLGILFHCLIVSIVFIFIAEYFQLLTLPTLGPHLTTLILAVFFLLLLFKKLLFSIPFIFIAILVNFILMTMISFGLPRYNEVIDYVFILCGTYCISLWIGQLEKHLREIRST